MLRTPEEIKKGLEVCTAKQSCSNECPYWDERTCTMQRNSTKMHVDARRYIERLEANIAAYKETIKQLEDENKRLTKAIRRADRQYYDSTARLKREAEAPIMGRKKWYADGGGSVT